MACLRLRTKDVDFDGATLTVQAGKGDKDRILTLPAKVIPLSVRKVKAMQGEIRSPLDDL